jgi:uncharacterized membrane protein
MTLRKRSPKLVAFVAAMAGLANVFGLLAIPVGLTSIHFMQLPIILTGLTVGAIPGGLVGLFGSLVMAFRLPTANPYIVVGNAILGLFTGFFYSRIKSWKVRPLIPQLMSVIVAYLIQAPYVYVTDIYLMSMPATVVQMILLMLLAEDIISLFISHIVMFRVNIAAKLS